MLAESRETAYLAWLSGTMIPYEQIQNLLMTYLSGESVYQAVSRRDPGLNDVLSPDAVQRLIRSADSKRINELENLIRKHQISSITLTDPLFPEILKEIRDPASILFYRGNPECLSGRKLSIVGSRSASWAGLKATEKIARDLSSHHIAIVSGFAYGIDTASHRGCLQGGSPTVAVMGCGLDQNYPADNQPLRDEIIRGGGILLSEYAPGEKPLGSHFPVRNRIISALGDALILMEAKIRSGSMVTVTHALSQGKDVFVYPGDPASLHFEGNHQLLREGAIYFTSARDILEDMKWLDNPPDQVQNNDCASSIKVFSPVEKAIYQALQAGSMSFEQLSSVTGTSPAELMSSLTILQVRGEIESLPGKKYQIRHE